MIVIVARNKKVYCHLICSEQKLMWIVNWNFVFCKEVGYLY